MQPKQSASCFALNNDMLWLHEMVWTASTFPGTGKYQRQKPVAERSKKLIFLLHCYIELAHFKEKLTELKQESYVV